MGASSDNHVAEDALTRCMSRQAELAAIEAHIATVGVVRYPSAFAVKTTSASTYGEIAARLAAMQLKKTLTVSEMVKMFYRWRRAA